MRLMNEFIGKLSERDQVCLSAAEGWFELGDFKACKKELEEIRPEMRAHPDVLKVRGALYMAALDWRSALVIAEAMSQRVPDDSKGWILKSFCLHILRRTQEARDNLLTVVERFPEEPMLFYGLACYECQLGRLKEAEKWLHKSFDVGDAKSLKLMSLEEPDLKPLMRSTA